MQKGFYLGSDFNYIDKNLNCQDGTSHLKYHQNFYSIQYKK